MRKSARFIIRTASDFHQQVMTKANQEGRSISEVVLGLLTAWLKGKATPDDAREVN